MNKGSDSGKSREVNKEAKSKYFWLALVKKQDHVKQHLEIKFRWAGNPHTDSRRLPQASCLQPTPVYPLLALSISLWTFSPGLLPKGKLTEADVTHYFSFPYNVFQNWYSIIVMLQMQYILMRKHRQQKDTHNPKQPEITNVNTLVYSLCIPYRL